MKLARKEGTSEIPTSSMADIAFLLIIFFMVTAVFVKVGADGSVLVDCRPMDLSEILPYLEPKLLRNPEKPVILYTDGNAPYQAMIAVYDVLGEPKEETHGYKIKNISVPTQSEIQEYIALFGLNPFETQCEG